MWRQGAGARAGRGRLVPAAAPGGGLAGTHLAEGRASDPPSRPPAVPGREPPSLPPVPGGNGQPVPGGWGTGSGERPAPGGWGPPGQQGPGGWGPGPGWPAPPRRPAGPGRDPRVAALIIVLLAFVAVLVRLHHVQVVSIIVFCVLVGSVILHEVSHGWVALAFGDDTAKRAGRLTLNPLAHVDIVGTIIVPVVMVLSGLGAFGWAKPVPVNVSRLRSPRNHAVLVSLAGPAVNLALAALSLGLYRFVVPQSDKLGVMFTGDIVNQPTWAQVVFFLGYVNVILAVFNLIPLPPLDGSAVLERLFPASWLPTYYRIRPFTLVLPLLLVALSSFSSTGGPLGSLFNWVLQWWGHLSGL